MSAFVISADAFSLLALWLEVEPVDDKLLTIGVGVDKLSIELEFVVVVLSPLFASPKKEPAVELEATNVELEACSELVELLLEPNNRCRVLPTPEPMPSRILPRPVPTRDDN